MFKGYRYLIVFLLVFLACSSENDEVTPEVNTTVTKDDIQGTWFVFAAETTGNYNEASPNIQECGFDHFIFSANGDYQEVLYNDSNCIPTINSANWVLEDGIIVLSSTTGERVEFPVLDYKDDQLVLNLQFDFDGDGNKETFKAYLRPYEPTLNNNAANSFDRDYNENTLLKFTWNQEKNSDSFKSYVVYRSQEGRCSKEDAILLAEINDISTTTFIDDDPPASQGNLCYFIKVYSKDGLLGESALRTQNPGDLVIPGSFTLNTVRKDDEDIFLEWDEFDIPYFSHYKIVYANSDGSNLLFHEEDSIRSIYSPQETTFLDTDPPYLQNPFFAVYAYNLFGASVVSNYKQIIYRRKELIGPIFLNHIEIDDDEPALYLHGSSKLPDWTSYDVNAVLRVNYIESLIESTTREEVYVSGEVPFRKPINFPDGKELILNGRSNLHFLDPLSLTENFSFSSFYLWEEFDLGSIVDFTYTENGFLVVINTDHVFVFQRNGEELVLLDKQIHYETHHGYTLYRMMQVNDNEIIVGFRDDEESIIFKIDENGLLKNRRVISLPLSSDYIENYKNTSFYSDSNHLLINYGQRTLYSTVSFEAKVQMPENLFALGMNRDANYIYASTNDPDWYGSDVKTEFLKREVLLFDTQSSQIKSVRTRGYPIRVFENNIGELFSISIPENQTITDFDVFIEKINFP